MKKAVHSSRFLSIDIGGSTIKAVVLDETGNTIEEFRKLPTPTPATPENVLETILTLTKDFRKYDKVSVGFPGYIRKGIVLSAPNLGTLLWQHTNLNLMLHEALKKPVRIVNDADLHGLGVVRGDGLEMVITLGTGFGTAMFLNGNLLPHLELAHHPVTKSKTYDQYIGKAAYKAIGKNKWNDRVKKVLTNLKTVFNYDHLYIGGGQASKLKFNPGEDTTLINNEDGIRGGVKLWNLDDRHFMQAHVS